MLLLALLLGGLIFWAVKLIRTGAGNRRRAGIVILVVLGALMVAFPFFVNYANSTEPERTPADPPSN